MERFAICSTQQINETVENSISSNTKKNNNWCTKVYRDWVTWRNNQGDRRFLLLDELSTATKADISNSLCHFIFEIRRRDGKQYPPNTLYNIACGVGRFIKNDNPDVKILSKEDVAFAYFQKCLDSRMIDLTKQGIGAVKIQASPVNTDQESQMWESGGFSLTDSSGLQRAVYFYMCKAFGLRACDEHRKLDITQLSFDEDSCGRYVKFTGRDNKVYKGGLNDRKYVAKEVKQYDSDNPRSVYKILELYIKCLHSCGIFHGPFYRRPLENITNQPRFGITPVGVNKIRQFLPQTAAIAELKGHFTAHSGKVTCATTLFHQNIDEQLIKDRTGHRSDAVRSYKRVSENQEKKVSAVLDPPPPKRMIIQCFKLNYKANFDLTVNFD